MQFCNGIVTFSVLSFAMQYVDKSIGQNPRMQTLFCEVFVYISNAEKFGNIFAQFKSSLNIAVLVCVFT